MSLPNPRTFMTQLFNSLPSSKDTHSTASNALKDAPASLKSLLVTLHVLFPNELLPALDVLDRKLVVRVRVSNDEHELAVNTSDPAGIDFTTSPDIDEQGDKRQSTAEEDNAVSLRSISENNSHPLYFVHSAQSQNQYQARYHHALPSATSCYEVRTSTWNCSCPAFAFSAFPMNAINHANDGNDLNEGDMELPLTDPVQAFPFAGDSTGRPCSPFQWGGVSRSRGLVPVCKHLLACMLLEKCEPVFGHCVEEKRLSVEEIAGWCAGWGG